MPHIEELDINPLIVDESGAIVVDARVVVRDAPPMRRYAHMAIHPYPSELCATWQPREGPPVLLRPIRPEDAQMEQAFVKGLSEHSRHMRFMNTLRELTPAMLARFTQIDYDRELAIIAVQENEGRETELGVARYVMNPDGETCEFAIVVADAWQGKGLARRMLEMLIDVARSRGLRTMIGHILSMNQPMIKLSEKLGFAIAEGVDDPTTKRATLALESASVR
jgi:acetyltransferase